MSEPLRILLTLLAVSAAALPTVAQPQQPVRVDIVAPTPLERLTAESVVEVEVYVAEGEELESVEVFLDGESLGVLAAPPYSFAVRNLSPASVHRIRAEARTRSGRRALDTLVLRNQPQVGISVRVDLVTLYAAVTDAEGNYVRGLTRDDFAVAEDGAPQEIAFFSAESTPLTLALLLDISSSMIGNRIARSQAAAVDLVGSLIGEDDAAMVLGFDHRLILYQPLTSDTMALEMAIRLTGPNGGTALYDAVAGTARKLFGLRGKRAVVLLSDGDDTDSAFDFDEVLDYLPKTGVILYSVGLQTLTGAQTRAHETRATIRQLHSLAEITGGQAYFPSFISHLPEIYAAIGRDLSSQYTIAYYPTSGVRNGRWREIAVSVRGRPDLTIRHRRGYFATP